MGAHFEISIASSEYINIRQFDGIWNALGSPAVFSDSWILPGFLFSREEIVPFQLLSQLETITLLQEGKVIEYNGTINQDTAIGIHQYMEQGKYYLSDLWFDTEKLPQFDAGEVSPVIRNLYDTVVTYLGACNALFFAMGPEMLFKFSANYAEMRKNSHGVLMWWFRRDAAEAANQIVRRCQVMVKHWKIDERIDHEPVIFLGCSTEESRCELLFCNYDGLEFKVTFPEAVDAIEIKYLEASVLCNDSAGELIEEAQCTGPINAFFIQTPPEQIVTPSRLSMDKFLSEVYYGVNFNKKGTLMQYIMIANATWINVFSYSPPTVEIMEPT